MSTGRESFSAGRFLLRMFVCFAFIVVLVVITALPPGGPEVRDMLLPEAIGTILGFGGVFSTVAAVVWNMVAVSRTDSGE